MFQIPFNNPIRSINTYNFKRAICNNEEMSRTHVVEGSGEGSGRLQKNRKSENYEIMGVIGR